VVADLGVMLRQPEFSDPAEEFKELAAADMRAMLDKVDLTNVEAIENLYPALLALKTGGLLKQ
jgi:hypothetical protein